MVVKYIFIFDKFRLNWVNNVYELRVGARAGVACHTIGGVSSGTSRPPCETTRKGTQTWMFLHIDFSSVCSTYMQYARCKMLYSCVIRTY